MTDKRRRVLAVGVAALDIINEVAAYPAEDAELRSLCRRIVRGGNAANTLAVLSQLGHNCAWVGTLGSDIEGSEVLKDLDRRGINTSACVRYTHGCTPTSYVVLSRASGSRTILHYRDLPELTAADFAQVPLDGFDWVHFEGRDPKETASMMQDCVGRLPGIGISLEVEKPRPGIETLFALPNVLIFSRHYARSRGCTDPRRFLCDQWDHTGARLLILPWGEEGAYAQLRGEEICYAPPHTPGLVIDTLGAGDVFNALVLDGLLAGRSLPTLLRCCNALAGFKCGILGLDDLVVSAREAGVL
ncbi:MAG: PfkB family carbohydrate kinase [Chromatiaceae bacterium]|nr:PfkB family carbohydrate kinase [Chromatiaceae bacterium]